MEYIVLAYWALNGFFGLLGASHRLDVDEKGRPAYILGFLPVWTGFISIAVFAALFLAHFLVPVLTFPEVNITQHIVNGSVSIQAHWYYPQGGGFAQPGWWLTFYFILAGLGPVSFYWVGWHVTDLLAASVELPRFVTLPEPPPVKLPRLPGVEVKPRLPKRGGDGISAAKILGLEVRRDE